MDKQDWSWTAKHRFTGAELLEAELDLHNFMRAEQRFWKSVTGRWLANFDKAVERDERSPVTWYLC